MYEIEDVEPHGNVDLTTTQIIAVSSNIGAMLIGQKRRPAEHGEVPPGLRLRCSRPASACPNETAGTLTPATQWSGSQADTITYGQGIAVTAIQLAAAMNTIANHGTYVAPRLVQATIDKSGKRHATPPSATHEVHQAADGAADGADPRAGVVRRHRRSARRASTATPWPARPAPATTPRTQLHGGRHRREADGGRLQGRTGNCHYNASFAGFLPAENPQLTILVSITEPPGDGRPLRRQHGRAACSAGSPSEALQQLQIPPSAERRGVPAAAEGAG